jgi:hypothetical protein
MEKGPAAPKVERSKVAASDRPVIKRWLNVSCSPEGAEAITVSGGLLVCKKVGSDQAPEWHVETLSESLKNN